MDYLERTAREHSEELAQLRARLDEAQNQCNALAARAEQAESAGQELARERDAARRETEQERGSCLSAQERIRALESRLAQAEEEAARLRGRVAQLTPDAEAYAALKDRAAGVELEAHRRAQGLVDEAQAQADALHRQAEQWLGGLRKEYGELCAQVESTVSHAASELDRVRQGLGNVSLCMDRQAGAVDRFLRAYEQKEAE